MSMQYESQRLELPPEEPDFGPWQLVPTKTFASALTKDLPPPAKGPSILAIDGRSASGKSTLAAAIANVVAHTSIVHTDDVAWHHGFFNWSELLLDGILKPARQGKKVAFRPPAWQQRAREGAIEVPKDCAFLILEGVGAARRELMPMLDRVIWVQSDVIKAEVRGIARDGGDEAAAAFWDEWMAAELPFLADQRPWERADGVVCGTPLEHNPASHIALATKTLLLNT